ncbi:MAG: hypothetical protein DMG71_08610 [Acidobacteria bacterium]|nr:MAG: hypothetical protein DMG71_08610 [Acidobacteriota bacterium]
MQDSKDRELGDRELGMDRKITRRDFLNGVALTVGAAMLPADLLAALDADPEKSPNYYPPALTGLRGSHVGSFEIAHSLRDGTFWDTAGKPADTGEIPCRHTPAACDCQRGIRCAWRPRQAQRIPRWQSHAAGVWRHFFD